MKISTAMQSLPETQSIHSEKSTRANGKVPTVHQESLLSAGTDIFTPGKPDTEDTTYVSDTVTLSTQAMTQVIQESRSEKIERLRASISAGTYAISNDVVANAILKTGWNFATDLDKSRDV